MVVAKPAMKYSSMNLKEPGIALPFPFPIKIIVEFRPNGVFADYAPMFYSADPEPVVDEIVRTKGWDRHPDYQPTDVWVDGGM